MSILLDSLRYIHDIRGNDKEKYFLLFDSFTLFLSQAAKEYDPESFESNINPFSLFAFLCEKTTLPDHLRYAGFKLLRQQSQSSDIQWIEAYEILYWTTIEIARHLGGKKFSYDEGGDSCFPPDEFWDQSPVEGETGMAKVVLTGKKTGTSGVFYGFWVDQEGAPVVVRPDKMMRIKNQMVAIEQMDHVYFPVTVHLFEVDVRDDVLFPVAMVLLPDYLIDITAISNCFSPFGEMTSIYLLQKVKPFSQSHHLLIGNCVNALLDELVYNPDLEWEEAVSHVFRINELQWASYSDKDTRLHIDTIRTHFLHLKNAVRHEFAQKGIDSQNCAVEPSFYSPEYGLQGRLDLLYESSDKSKRRAIIELKSGKSFKPNSYGLNHPHYLQTLLYDLLIRSAHPDSPAPVNYILYSAEEEKNLRHAPAIRDWQYEALGVRNQIVIMEWQLARWTKNKTTLYELLQAKNENLIGFVASDRNEFYQAYEAATPLVRSYFDEYLKFLVREQMTSKLGVFSSDRKGQSQLWATSWQNKDQQYQLLSHLVVTADHSFDDNPTVTFSKTEGTNPLANFRTGDVILTYPAERRDHPEQGQIFRCTLVENTKDQVTIRLRARQYRAIFSMDSEWFVEHDHLDSSFRYMNQALSYILQMKPDQAELYLGMRPPVHVDLGDDLIKERDGLTQNQNEILHSMMAMQDYYLLWGPPGTGKTSVMLREYVREQTQQDPECRILLLGYTNRAVDEICAAVAQLDHIPDEEVLRIGSRYGTDPAYTHLLWRVKAENIPNRRGVHALLDRSRIICATIASLSGQEEIFDLISFDRIVIDEASQILEPAILPLLSRGIPYILIGDHKQLPAVVSQSLENTLVENQELLNIGLQYMANSYFERLFLINKTQEWNWSHGILHHQGRMHRDLMTYPNLHFYENILSVLPFQKGDQEGEMVCSPQGEGGWADVMATRRNVFIPTISRHALNHKINPEEAEKIVEILQYLQKIRPDLQPEDIGIITPYRAQIATIRYAMNRAGMTEEGVTVDTVERYQGGAKDIIIISYCVNAMSQIQLLRESMTPEGIDRKLNVALTRAREQIIFLANESLMREHPLYESLVEHFGRVESLT